VLVGLYVAGRVSNASTRKAAEAAAAGSVHATVPEEPEVLPPTGPRRRPTGPNRSEGGFPIPPMDLVVPPSPRLRSREPVGATPGAVVGTGRRGTTPTASEGAEDA
jgi:NADH-quinone oxidoreductase subunit H